MSFLVDVLYFLIIALREQDKRMWTDNFFLVHEIKTANPAGKKTILSQSSLAVSLNSHSCRSLRRGYPDHYQFIRISPAVPVQLK